MLWRAAAILLLAASGNLDRGIEAFRRRDFAAAEQTFLRATAEQPRSVRAWKWLGMLYAATAP